jgi:hypothetical protein
MASFCLASASLGALRPANSKAAPLRARNARLSVRAGAINPDIKKDEPKVVDTVKCSDVKGKVRQLRPYLMSICLSIVIRVRAHHSSSHTGDHIADGAQFGHHFCFHWERVSEWTPY